MKSFKKHKINKRTNKIKKAEEVNKLLDYDEESEFSEDLQIRQMRQELRRVKYNYRFVSALYSTIGTMLVVAAIAVLIANLWLPVLQVTGASMSPTLEEGQVLLANKGSNLETGDIIAFYYNNKILVKRVIAVAGDWVYIDETGKVYVNDIAIDEPYLTDKALGNCNIEMPYQVPESQIFVMGDHRSVSLDSSNTTIGCISEEQILGNVYYCLWPVESLGKIK